MMSKKRLAEIKAELETSDAKFEISDWWETAIRELIEEVEKVEEEKSNASGEKWSTVQIRSGRQ